MSPVHHRLEKVNSLLQTQIADIIRSDIKDPRLGFCSVVGVETSGDLRHANVKVSVLGGDEEKKRTLETLVRAAAFIREKLLRRIEIRRIPQLEFLLDENIEYSIHIAKVLDDLRRPGGEGESRG